MEKEIEKEKSMKRKNTVLKIILIYIGILLAAIPSGIIFFGFQAIVITLILNAASLFFSFSYSRETVITIIIVLNAILFNLSSGLATAFKIFLSFYQKYEEKKEEENRQAMEDALQRLADFSSEMDKLIKKTRSETDSKHD